MHVIAILPCQDFLTEAWHVDKIILSDLLITIIDRLKFKLFSFLSVCFQCISEIEYAAALTDIKVILKTPKQTVIQEHFSIPSLLLFASLKLVVHQDPNYC
jgi:hypothetical protein